MFRPVNLALFFQFVPALLIAAQVFPLEAFAAVPESSAGDHRAPRNAAAEAIATAVNTVITADIGIPPADFASCPLDALPAARAKLLPLLPPRHRELIADCARGRTRVQRNVRGFNLLALLEDPVDDADETAKIRAFFDERTVDVAMGSAVSDEPYPLAFDWAVVLDTQAGTIYSFIVNCRD